MYTRFVPNMYGGGSMAMNAMRGASAMGTGMNAMRGFSAIPMGMNAARGVTSGGLMSRLGGTLSSLKGLNWGGFINNASKTIGVINQTIPLVKQAGPMFRNIKSVMKLVSVFKDETDPIQKKKTNSKNYSKVEKSTTISDSTQASPSEQEYASEINVDNSPIFFVS